MVRFFSLSPALRERMDRLASCRGRWTVDCRQIEGDYSFALRSLRDHWPIIVEGVARYWHSLDGLPNIYKLNSVEDAAQYCAATRWQAKLLFSPDQLNADCLWPGCYEASSIHRSNNRAFKDWFKKELLMADGDADGLAMDVRFITEEMLETIESLETYCILSEDDHSELEMLDQDEAWENWASADFSSAVEKRLAEFIGDDIAESICGVMPDSAWLSFFRSLMEATNTYWEEESSYGQYIDIDRLINGASEEALAEFVADGLSALQQAALAPVSQAASEPAQAVACAS